MVAALTRLLGPHNLELAEEVVQESLIRALETWKIRGLPDNPAAWLMQTAKHRALDVIRRERTFKGLAGALASEYTLVPALNEAFTEHAIKDDLLRMMFACCDPDLSEEVQVALVLKLLCGFGVGEIAAAFLVKPDAIEKRITRGRQALQKTDLEAVLRPAEIEARLPGVLQALYLLFNEGYHGSFEAVRGDLCYEAMRLCLLLARNEATARPEAFALLALMCYGAARLDARSGEAGLIQLEHQDRAKWDRALIQEGNRWLDRAAVPNATSTWHLEAAIAATHCAAQSFAQTDWPTILNLYDALYQARKDPIVGLNRAIVVGQVRGAKAALGELERLPEKERLQAYPFYFAALAEFAQRSGDATKARTHLRQALYLARNEAERAHFKARLAVDG
jgi:RNA polymerase sigma-70 factor (ECF subfamily)